nr:MAG TPA: hyaluronase tail fiber protein [Caudoviricetes sp.]
MAYTLPHTAITKIPDTEPDAVPELWNDTYAEIDANFARIVGFNPVGKCLTAGDVAEKTVDCENFTLAENSVFTVRFEHTNSASRPSLNVNGTGARAIKYRGSSIKASMLAANRVYQFVYDGTEWDLIGDLDTGDQCLPLTGGTLSGALTVQGNVTAQDPTQAQHVVTKKHLESALSSLSADAQGKYLPLKGGTLSGALTVRGNVIASEPKEATHLTTRKYVDDAVDTIQRDTADRYLKQAGGTITGNLTVQGPCTVREPEQNSEAATKAYVDTAAAKATIKMIIWEAA